MAINFSLAGVEPKLGGSALPKVPEGAYACRIQSVELDETPGSEQLLVRVDIVEGPFTGAFDSSFAKENPWSHEVRVRFTDFNGKPKDPALIAGDLMRISDWNEGFNAAAAFDRRDWASFFGKRCCALRRYRKYQKTTDGMTEVKDEFQFYRLVTRDEAKQDWAQSPKPNIPDSLWGTPVTGRYSDWRDCHPDLPTPDGIAPGCQAPAPAGDRVPDSAYDGDFMVGRGYSV